MENIKDKIINGGQISPEEARQLTELPTEQLCNDADEIRRHFCGSSFDMCTIINGKSGRCSENCKFCAQAGCYDTEIEEYPLLSGDRIVREAEYNRDRGVMRYSVVTSGKRLSDDEIDELCTSIRKIKGIKVCVSLGLLNEDQFRKLREAGAGRVHNNLETGRSFFRSVCSTHTYDEKVAAIKAAKAAGLEVCSGGIMGLGESMDDRIEMAFELRSLGIRSVPVNMLNPIPGTPLAARRVMDAEEMRRTVAIYRFILPDAYIRLAGGRGLLPDKGRACFRSGANAAITGDMLTTAGISIETDMKMMKELGYEVTCR